MLAHIAYSTPKQIGSTPRIDEVTAALGACIRENCDPKNHTNKIVRLNCNQLQRLDIVIQRELIGMRTQTHGVNFVIEFVRNPVSNEVFGKYTRLNQESMIIF